MKGKDNFHELIQMLNLPSIRTFPSYKKDEIVCLKSYLCDPFSRTKLIIHHMHEQLENRNTPRYKSRVRISKGTYHIVLNYS